MPNPVQIVLNDRDYLRAPEPGHSGPDKDFFEGRDAAFCEHRDRLANRVMDISRALASSPYGPATYLRVCIRQEAIAKSYRPSRVLLTSDRFPCVGAGEIGELFVHAPEVHLAELHRRILSAEDLSQARVSRNGNQYVYVTRMRSEVGAIADIEVAPPEQKRPFSAQAAVQWLQDAATVGGYIVELFESPPETTVGADILGRRRMVESLGEVLLGLGLGTRAVFLPQVGRLPVVEVRLLSGEDAPRLEDHREVRSSVAVRRRELARPDLDVARHEKALAALAAHPLVRRIRLPLRLTLSEEVGGISGEPAAPFLVPRRSTNGRYPKVGVIDTGICAAFDEWVLHRHDFLDTLDVHQFHGSFIAGLLVAGRSANSTIGRLEPDGCDLVDIPLFPQNSFSTHYRRGFDDFLEEVESGIRDAVENHNIRVFNLSINVTSPVEPNIYSTYAARLDEIQDRYGVVLVNSAGNLPATEWRAPWPRATGQVLSYFANRTLPDTVLLPCESARALAVGALNPPGTDQAAHAPTVYTRRGPGLRVGVKPDVAHYGGAGDSANPGRTGLLSSNEAGNTCGAAGTSFAAPLVAKTLATIDEMTNLTLASRTLRAFSVHSSETPESLRSPRLRQLARQFVGFGQPTDAASMLETDDHSITLVFESRLTAGLPRPAILRFTFAWPSSLVVSATGACRGRVKMTLVYDPPLDPAFGAEFARVNLDAHLQQRQPGSRKDGSPRWSAEVAQGFLPSGSNLVVQERILIREGLKWWPTKRYERTLPSGGIGSSSEWRLQIDSLVRAEASFPTEGVPFSLILTIEDEERRRPVFREMFQGLQANNVALNDIRVVQRVRQRGRQ